MIKNFIKSVRDFGDTEKNTALALSDLRHLFDDIKHIQGDTMKEAFKARLTDLCDTYWHLDGGLDRQGLAEVLLKQAEEILRADYEAKKEGLV